MKLKTKSLLNASLSTLIISCIIGYITLKNSEEILEKNISLQIQADAKKINNHIDNIEKNFGKTTKQLQNSETVLASLNLISSYEDKENYKASVFDAEKMSLMDFSERFFAKESFYLLEFFDKQGSLIIKKSFHKTLPESGVVTYKNGAAYFKNDEKLEKLVGLENLNKECAGELNKKYKKGCYKLCKSSALHVDNSLVGFAKITHFFGEKELEKLQKNLIHPVSLTQSPPNKSDATISVLDKKTGVYIKHHIDFSYYEQKRQELLVLIVISVVLLALLMFIISTLFINKEVLKPLKGLQKALESMLKNRYRPIELENDDEINKIFQASNKIFKKFWQNYSSLESYQKSVDTANLVTKTDLSGNITYANKLFCKTSGYTKKEVLGKPHNIVRHPDMHSEVFADLWQTIKSGKIWKGMIKNRTKQGGFYWVDAVISPTYDADENIEGYISIRRDITELIKSKEALEYRANHDLLTGLRNRNKLLNDIENTATPCLILMDINRFSQVNDFYGHSFGDKLLQKFSKVLQAELESLCVHQFGLYRNGGDEFAILLENAKKEKILSTLSLIIANIENNSLIIEEKELNLSLACGISFETTTKAFLSANIALKLSKTEKKPFVVYSQDNSLEKQYENNLAWSLKLKRAIQEDRLIPFFQPIVNNQNLAYEKYESLVRIIDTDGKAISPFFFLDVAKQTKQYLKLTKIMVEKCFERFADTKLEFSINLTMEDISSKEFKDFLFAKLDANPNTSKHLVLEIVETEYIQDYDTVIDFITTVKLKGCKIAIDDFGSGYSNFEYLIKLQADYIKIDGSLIKNIATQRESYVVVATIVRFAKEMGIQTIAEFIENEEIFHITKELGIDYSQGYYFQAPQKEIQKQS